MTDVYGAQVPTYSWVPAHSGSAGPEAIDLAASAGLILDPWQETVLNGGLATSLNWDDQLDRFRWQCFEVGCIVSRQNGKGSFLEALELAKLFLFDEKLIIHSAHLFNTSREHFFRMEVLIDNQADARHRIRSVRRGKGDEQIELVSGQRLKFMTRQGGSGRGFTADTLVFDEAMILDADPIAAMLPTLATRPNAQVWYAGSAGMKNSTQLDLVRRRGLARSDPRLAFFMWTVDERPFKDDCPHNPDTCQCGDDRSAPTTWAKANPGMGIRITEEAIRREAAAMGGANSKAFGIERLGIGDWPEAEMAWAVISKTTWELLLDEDSAMVGSIALAVDADEDRDQGCIAAVGRNADGRMHYEVVQRGPGTGWLAARLIELDREHHPRVVAVHSTSAAASVIPRLRAAKVKVISPTTAEYAATCGLFYEDIAETGNGVHIGQESLTTAVGGVHKKPMGDGTWVWDRKGETIVDIAPLVAVTLARFGFTAKYIAEPWLQQVPMNGAQKPPPDEQAQKYLAPADAARRGSGGYAAARRGGY